MATDFERFGTPIVAAVAWTSGTSFFARKIQYQLIRDDLCPFMPTGASDLAPGLGVPTDDVALSWSESEQAVWATFHDTRNVYRARVTGEVADAPQVIVEGQLLINNFRAAFAQDGRGVAAWFASDSPLEFLNDRRRLRAVLLGPKAEPRIAAATAAATPFELAIPTPFQAPDLINSLALAARNDRYALAFHGVIQPETRPVAHVLELDAGDGRPRGVAWRVDPNTGEGHARPSLTYLPDDNMLVAWASASGQGVVAQLFQSGGVPRFSGVSCNESRFAVGARAPEENRGLSSVFRAGDDAWVLHVGEPNGDPAALAWWLPYADLWPAKK